MRQEDKPPGLGHCGPAGVWESRRAVGNTLPGKGHAPKPYPECQQRRSDLEEAQARPPWILERPCRHRRLLGFTLGTQMLAATIWGDLFCHDSTVLTSAIWSLPSSLLSPGAYITSSGSSRSPGPSPSTNGPAAVLGPNLIHKWTPRAVTPRPSPTSPPLTSELVPSLDPRCHSQPP